MAGYVDCPYTPTEWRKILSAAQAQLGEMQLAVNQVRRLERYAVAVRPGYDIFPIDDDANAVMQAIMNAKWGNILGDIGAAASESLFRYKSVIVTGKPAAFLNATISDYDTPPTKSLVVANAGEPFASLYGHASQGDRVSVGWTQSDGVARLATGLFVEDVAAANTLRLTTCINPELVVNGTFDADTDWTKGTGWTIAGGVAVALDATGALEAAVALTGLTVGALYELSFTISGYDHGELKPTFTGLVSQVGTNRTANGTYTETFTADATTAELVFSRGTVTELHLNLDTVSVREIVPSADTTVAVTLEATYVA